MEKPDLALRCPACKEAPPLRSFQTRLVCDTCEGMMLALEDLSRAIDELVQMVPTFEVIDQKPGTRRCPRCEQAMTTCHLRVVLMEEVAKPRPELDRCSEHGLWFDGDELAAVFEKVRAKMGSGHGGAGAWPTTTTRGVPKWIGHG